MKKRIFFVGIVVTLTILLATGPVFAAPLGSWTTDFTLFNLSNSAPANITIKRYTQCVGGCSVDAGTTVVSTQIATGGSYYYNPASDSSFPSGFAGSIVVSSDQQLAGTVTLANNLTGVAYASDAYSAVSGPAMAVFLPIVLRQGPWSTRMTVQNAGTSNTNVTITYVGAGAPSPTTINNLPPNMMAMVDLSDPAFTGVSFNGSASVSATQNVAVVVEEYKDTGGVLVTYNGVPSANASNVIYMPGYIDQSVWATDFTIVNTTGSSATATVTFAGSGATLTGPISANGSAYLNRYTSLPGGWSGTFPTNYYGSATITMGAVSQKVVVAYNIANSGTGGPGNLADGYVGFATSGAALNVVVPLIENVYSTGWVTTFSVQSIDGTAPTLAMTYSGNLAPLCNPCNVTMSGPSRTFNQTTDGHVPAGFLGGVRIVSNKNIVVIADQANASFSAYAGGDSAAGFVGFPAP